MSLEDRKVAISLFEIGLLDDLYYFLTVGVFEGVVTHSRLVCSHLMDDEILFVLVGWLCLGNACHLF